MMTLIVSDELLARDRHTDTHTVTRRLEVVYVKKIKVTYKING